MTTRFTSLRPGVVLFDQVAGAICDEIHASRLAVGFSPLQFDTGLAAPRSAVIQVVEVQRALEAEVDALAAQREADGRVHVGRYRQAQACRHLRKYDSRIKAKA